MRLTSEGLTPRDILAFDPGPHTGVALFRGGELCHTETVTDAEGRESLYQRLATVVRLEGNPIIVIENYRTVGPMTTEGTLTVKLMGWLEGLALTGGYECRFQMPSAKRAWLTEAASLVKVRGGTRHERDAVAHGLACLNKQDGRLK